MLSYEDSSIVQYIILLFDLLSYPEIIDFLQENGAFYQIRSSKGIVTQLDFSLDSDKD